MDRNDLLRRLADNPLIYVGKRSVERIDAFLCGYAVCAYDHHIERQGQEEYDEFLRRKYVGGERVRWSRILLERAGSEQEAFRLFVETVHEFLDGRDSI